VIRDTGNVSGEYIDSEVNTQVTKPFVAEFFRNASFPYDTELIAGDVIKFDITSEKYMVMNKSPEMFSNTVAEYAGVLYKCNVSGEILRPSGELRDSQYHTVTEFDTIREDCFGLLTEPLYAGELETEEELGLLGIDKEELYLPTNYDIRVMDRYQSVSGEYYMVTTIRKNKYSGCVVAVLEEDLR
jgi:hypothetical protein